MAEENNNVGLFSRLKRLFGTDVIIRNIGGNQLKVVDVDRIQAFGNIKTNALIDRFTKLHRYGANMPYNPTMNYQTLRIQLYTDYEAMDTESIIASALDIISDESTLKNENGEVIQIMSPDENIQRILYNLFYDVLNIERAKPKLFVIIVPFATAYVALYVFIVLVALHFATFVAFKLECE